MKQLTCRDLGGPCDKIITGDTFEEMGKNCHVHVLEMIAKGDHSHQDSVNAMKNASPETQSTMMNTFQSKFEQAKNV